ncbi:MAG: aromatic ring-hydroxylating oxygenase subunit alpha [Hyphomicrobiaceae bacterium]
MRQDTQVALTEEIFAHLDANSTAMSESVTINPVASYICPDRLSREQDVIRRSPVLMGLGCRLSEPRSYLTDDNTGVPILLLRDDAGRARAFLNACKHRGSRMLEGVGQVRRRLVCPYHAWTYDLDGTLKMVPQPEGFSGLDYAECGLTELPILEEDGLIWVRPIGNTPIDGLSHLGALREEIASYGLGNYHHYETRRIDCAMNWKTIIDTFLEPYHFTPLHIDTVAPLFIPSLCLFDAYGSHLREVLPRRSIEELRSRTKSEWSLLPHAAIVYVLFPNTVFIMLIDHVEVWRVFPNSERPDKSHVNLEFYTPEPATSESARGHWDRSMNLTIRTVLEEDFPTGEGAQISFASKRLSSVIYGRNEPALAHFQRSIAAAVGETI